jgi:PPOX class probable F420-dependent enzyme
MRTLDDLARNQVILLTTVRKDGRPVDTPVNVAVNDGHAYVRTWATSGKAKRIARNPNVTVAPSTYRGTATGPAVPALARMLSGAQAQKAGELIDRRYPIIQRRLVPLAHRVRKVQPALYELTLEETARSASTLAVSTAETAQA